MKIVNKILLFSLALIALILPGCSNKQKAENKGNMQNKTVTIYMWGGSDSTNEYMDKWVAPKLKEQKGNHIKKSSN